MSLAGKPLTAREVMILRWLAKGMSCREIADLQDVATPTVMWIRYSIHQKLGLISTPQLAEYARKHHFIR